jgi:tRNA G10  N-methylase Trm11
MIFTCYQGKNCDLLKEVSALYFKPGMKISDVTFGKGNFWNKIDVTKFQFYPSDIMTGIDFRSLPYEDRTFDVIVLDPPYVHNDGSYKIGATYNNHLIEGHFSTVLELYQKGIAEAYRVLKPRGMLLVKCQDIVEYRQQRWAHIEIFNLAKALNFYAKDLFILHQDTIPMVRIKPGFPQHHGRRNHSYLWIFTKRVRREKGLDDLHL